jgi:hypothetical protein
VHGEPRAAVPASHLPLLKDARLEMAAATSDVLFVSAMSRFDSDVTAIC